MKAVQIGSYSKQIHTVLNHIPTPRISDSEVLIRVKAAAVNLVELLILTESVKLIQDSPIPLTLGNECSGIVEQTGKNVTGFQKGDRVYPRLPLHKTGAFAEYVAVDQKEIAKMPEGYDFTTAAAIPLTGLTAFQAIAEELEATPGQTLLIPGGSGRTATETFPFLMDSSQQQQNTPWGAAETQQPPWGVFCFPFPELYVPLAECPIR